MEAVYLHLSREGTAEDRRAFLDVLDSPFWKAANSEQRSDLLDLFKLIPLHEVDGESGAQGRGVRRASVALAELAGRTLQGKSALLDVAHGGSTLVHELASAGVRLNALSTRDPVLRETGLPPGVILGGLILEVNDSERICQGNANTCTVTTLTIMLVDQNPAEYARLAAGLLVDGEVRMRNGDRLKRQPASIAPAVDNHRTPSERILQSALMTYSTGGNYQSRTEGGYVSDPVLVTTVLDTLPTWVQVLSWILLLPALIMKAWPLEAKGLTRWEVDRTAQGLFGEAWEQSFTNVEGSWVFRMARSAESHVRWLLERNPTGDFTGDRIMVHLQWGGYHALKLEHLDSPDVSPRMVTLRNPGRFMPLALMFDSPPNSVWVDPQRRTLAIPLEEFKERLKGLNYSEHPPVSVAGRAPD